MGQIWAVVVAAGSGARFGGAKQFSLLHGRTVLDWSLSAARAACTGVVAVVPGADLGRDLALRAPPDVVVAGGATRSASVRAGLAAVPPEAEVIVVHDAARPLAGPALWEAAIGAVSEGADAAICVVPVTDTIKRVLGATVIETLDREGLVAVQTPQAFRAAALRGAHAAGGESTDDAGLVEAAGGAVVTVPGSPHNLKITHAHDMAVAAALLGLATA